MFTRISTVGHGIEQSGTWANRPLNASHGMKWFADDKQRGFTYDSRRGVWWPDDGRVFYDATTNYLVDAFGGGTLYTGYTGDEGSGGTDFAITAGSLGGIITGATGATDNNTVAITGPALAWLPTDGTIRMGCRLHIGAAVTTAAINIGLTDTVASGTLEMPAELSVVTYTTTATDAVVFLFDTDATTDTVRCCGVADDTDGTHVDSSVVPVASTYNDFLMEVTAAGVATFYIDEVLVGTVAAACTPAVPLVPIIAAEARTTTTRTIVVDNWF